MLIGPLTSQPPLAPFAHSLAATLNAAGVMKGEDLFLPTGVNPDGSIGYESTEVDFVPLCDRSGALKFARDLYSGRTTTKRRESPFLRQIGIVEGAMGCKALDLTAMLRRAAECGAKRLPDMDSVIAGLEALGERGVGDLFVKGAGEVEGGVEVEGDFLFRVARALNFAVDVHRGGTARMPLEVVAELSSVAGILYAKFDDMRSRCMAVDSFLISSSMFSEAGLYVAAGIAAEMAQALFIELPTQPVLDGKGFTRAAQSWLSAASESLGSDEAGVPVALYRGILSALLVNGDEADRVRRALHRFSADHCIRMGVYDRAGQEFLREAFAAMIGFRATPEEWSDMADLLGRAKFSYRQAGVGRGVLHRIDALERTALDVALESASALSAFQNMVDAEGRVRPRQMVARSRVKLAHGDFNGAIEDMNLAYGADPRNPDVLSETGFVYHHLMNFHAQMGRLEKGRLMLSAARRFLDEAFEAAQARDVTMPFLFARSGAVAASMGDYDRAVWELNLALKMDPGDAEIHDYLSAVKILPNIITIR